MKWLGTPWDRFSGEDFPEGKLNSKQLGLVLTMNDQMYGRVIGTSPATQPVAQITEDIVEVHVMIAKHEPVGRHCALWINSRGQMVASAHTTLKGDAAESHWTLPADLDRFGKKPITQTHDRLWGLGDTGAIQQTRKFIREHYTESE